MSNGHCALGWRLVHTLSIIHCFSIYKDVLCLFIRPECSLCWSITMFSLGQVVFLPKMWVVLQWMEIMSSETREGYGLRIAHSSMIYPSPLCKVLIVKSSWYRNYHMISLGWSGSENCVVCFCNKVWCAPRKRDEYILMIHHCPTMYGDVLYTI